MRKLSKIIQKNESGIKYPEDSAVVLQCLVGIELELENVDASTIMQYTGEAPLWNTVGDGSLRNNGIELVSVPIAGVNIPNALESLDTILKQGAKTAEISERCSMHVHIDMRDVTVRQLLNFLIVYTIFEEEFFKYVGYYRKDNPYCVPLVDAYNLQELMEKLTGTDRQVERLINQWPKYSALNLKSLLKLGTVEIRLHPGTTDTKEILHWVNILLSIKKYILDNPRRNTQSIIDSVCADPEGLISAVFNGIFLDRITSDITDSMLDGARIAQQVYRYRELQTDAPVMQELGTRPHARARVGRPARAREPQQAPYEEWLSLHNITTS